MINKAIIISGLSLLLTTNIDANIPEEDIKPDLEEITSIPLTSEDRSDLACEYYLEGEYDKGIEEAKKAVELKPTNHNYKLLGSLYFAKEDMINTLNSLIAAYYYDQDDKFTKKALSRLKGIMELDDDRFNKAIKAKFLELDYEQGIFLQYDKFNDIFK